MVQTRARYIGDAFGRDYSVALVLADGDGWVRAQFDEWSNTKMNIGWHTLPQRDFVVLEGYDELPEIPEEFGKPKQQRGRQVFYGVSMSNRVLPMDDEPPVTRLRRIINRQELRAEALRRNPCREVFLEPQDMREQGEPIRHYWSPTENLVEEGTGEQGDSIYELWWQMANQTDEELAS